MTGNQQQGKKTAKNHKHVETKQLATKQPMEYWRNQRGNLKILRSNWQQRHNNPKPMGLLCLCCLMYHLRPVFPC